jgi:cobalamin synthase
MNSRRSHATDEHAEQIGINGAIVLSIVVLMSWLLLSTLAKTACAPAVRLVPAYSYLLPPYQQVQHWPASEQAGELARFHRENF